MAYDIIIGRTASDRKKFGDRGTILLGRSYVKMGATTSLSNRILMDVAKPHTILVAGKKGSGKSYSLSVMAEEMARLPHDVKKNLSMLFFDTMGIFWTMKYPNERDEDLLRKWNLEPEGFDIDVYVPQGSFEEYQEKGLPVDHSFSIKTSELNAEDWCNVFDIKTIEPLGILIDRIVSDLKDEGDFDIIDIIRRIKVDKRSTKDVKDAAENRFLAAQKWGLFDRQGTKIEELVKPGKVTVLDISAYRRVSGAWSIKGLVVGLISKKILAERIVVRKAEELEAIEEGTKYFGEEEKQDKPLVWLFIDECLPGDAEVITDKAHTPIKEIVEKFEKGEKIKVLGYDCENDKYDHYDVTKVHRIPKRNLIELTTETGRKLKCTSDHNILTRDNFISAVSAKEIATPLIQHHSENKKCIRARLLGHIYGDGWLCKNKTVGFSGNGNEGDLLKIKDDLKKLGFKSSSIHSRITKSKINHYKRELNVKGLSQDISAATKAFRYFKELGAPIGQKVLNKVLVPRWLLNASEKEKAEFLGALFGSDGVAPSMDKNIPTNFNPIRLKFNKADYLEKEALEYANQIKKLFSNLGIEISNISKYKANLRKDGVRTIQIVITLSKKTKNIIKFLEKIGYRYCKVKEIKGNKWLAYLKARQEVVNKRINLRTQIRELYKKGISGYKLSKRFNIPYYQVKWWLKKEDRPRPCHSFPNFNDWINKRCNQNLIYEKVINIKECKSEELYDISVDKVHNFIANGCIVHNCHEFLPRVGKTPASDALIQVIREGRQPGISMVIATQQPGEIARDVMTQSDIIFSHRVTAKADIEALNAIMQTYLLSDVQGYLNNLPSLKGSAIILDDNSERIYPMRVRPKISWHGGETPSSIKVKKREELSLL